MSLQDKRIFLTTKNLQITDYTWVIYMTGHPLSLTCKSVSLKVVLLNLMLAFWNLRMQCLMSPMGASSTRSRSGWRVTPIRLTMLGCWSWIITRASRLAFWYVSHALSSAMTAWSTVVPVQRTLVVWNSFTATDEVLFCPIRTPYVWWPESNN